MAWADRMEQALNRHDMGWVSLHSLSIIKSRHPSLHINGSTAA